VCECAFLGETINRRVSNIVCVCLRVTVDYMKLTDFFSNSYLINLEYVNQVVSIISKNGENKYVNPFFDVIDDYFHPSRLAYYMNENIFYQRRRRLVTLITRPSIGYRYSLPSDNVFISCNKKFVEYFIWRRMLFLFLRI
jgi:hypothetical protein